MSCKARSANGEYEWQNGKPSDREREAEPLLASKCFRQEYKKAMTALSLGYGVLSWFTCLRICSDRSTRS